MKNKKTYSAKAGDIKRSWYLLDAGDKILGRVAVKVSNVLRGKNKAMFTRHMDTGDYVVVLNARSVRVTGAKTKDKVYFTHSDYPGGAKSRSFEEMMKRDPRKVMRRAVRGMLPKGRLGDQMIKKMYVFVDNKHTFGAWEFKTL
ncbi:MAG: 50S ribosomal protein L13 [Candidatus Margulisbacteria bacterium]|nr:50S ribosomal protein L13 [Candidatus Margulisiibacteriota bacterium]